MMNVIFDGIAEFLIVQGGWVGVTVNQSSRYVFESHLAR